MSSWNEPHSVSRSIVAKPVRLALLASHWPFLPRSSSPPLQSSGPSNMSTSAAATRPSFRLPSRQPESKPSMPRPPSPSCQLKTPSGRPASMKPVAQPSDQASPLCTVQSSNPCEPPGLGLSSSYAYHITACPYSWVTTSGPSVNCASMSTSSQKRSQRVLSSGKQLSTKPGSCPP